MAKLVHDQDSAATNVLRYGDELAASKGLQDRLGQHRRWYAYARKGEWHFGPSKWSGYEWQTADDYLSNASEHDGRVTEGVLKTWSQEVSSTSKLGKRLHDGLAAFLATYGKSPSASTVISVFDNAVASPDDLQTEGDGKLILLILEVVNSMSHEDRKAIKSGIRL